MTWIDGATTPAPDQAVASTASRNLQGERFRFIMISLLLWRAELQIYRTAVARPIGVLSRSDAPDRTSPPFAGSRLLYRLCAVPRRVRADAEERDQARDDNEEYDARLNGAQPQSAIRPRLGEQVAERGTQWTRQDIGEPEGQNRIGAEIVRCGNGCDQDAERQDTDVEPETQRFCCQISGGRPQGEGEEDGGPIKDFAPRGHDRMYRERPLDCIPNREGR